MNLFLSYTRMDEAPVRALVDDLERMGRSIWLDHQIHGGAPWWQEILQQIQDAEVFLFALSKDSLRSRPCRTELRYAEQLRVPVIPVQVGSVENLRIPVAGKQIIDYRRRSADAVIELIAAIVGFAALPRELPDPMPEPPGVPFEYLYRLAGEIDVQEIPRKDQGRLIAELRQELRDEEDAVARNDILSLLKDLRSRREITVPNAAEIDGILSSVEAAKVPLAEGGATRLPPADFWRRSRANPAAALPPSTSGDAGRAPTSTPVSPERPAKQTLKEPAAKQAPKQPLGGVSRPVSAAGASPETVRTGRAETGGGSVDQGGRAPDWIAGHLRPRAPENTHPAGESGSDPPARGEGWWVPGRSAEQERKNSVDAPTWVTAVPSPAPPQTPTPAAPPDQPSSYRFAFAGAVLGSMGIGFVLAVAGRSAAAGPVLVTMLLLASVLGLSMSAVAMTRREPGAKVAVTLATVGLVGVIVSAAVTGAFS